MNKILGIDIDDCACNTLEMDLACGLYYAKLKNIELPDNAWECKNYYVPEEFKFSKEAEDEFFVQEKQFIMQHTAMYPKVFVKEVIDKLKQKGFKINFITSRLNYFWNDNSHKHAVKWLKKHKIKFDKVYANLDNKLEVCKKLNIDFMIEDNLNFVKKLNDNNIKTILIKTDYNKEYSNENNVFVHNWLELYVELGKIYGFETNDLIYQNIK